MKKNQTNFIKLCLADALLKLMETEPFDTINVNAICERAGVGRTSFYRYFDNKNSKEDLLLFKIGYEWDRYAEDHAKEAAEDGGKVLLLFIYEYRRIFRLLYREKLISVIMRLFEDKLSENWPQDKSISYLKAFFVFGYFGTIYQWIKYDFDETPEQVLQHIAETLALGIKKQQEAETKKDAEQKDE